MESRILCIICHLLLQYLLGVSANISVLALMPCSEAGSVILGVHALIGTRKNSLTNPYSCIK
jgi:hypothetical protein